jgi:AbrB family looped-hinge helix DNA binding protein
VVGGIQKGAKQCPPEQLQITNMLPVINRLTTMPIVRKKEIEMSNDATLTSKGQTTIPKEIRDSLSMKAGDRMTFTLMPDGTVVMRVKTKSITELAGVLHKKGRKPVPVEQLSR